MWIVLAVRSELKDGGEARVFIFDDETKAYECARSMAKGGNRGIVCRGLADVTPSWHERQLAKVA